MKSPCFNDIIEQSQLLSLQLEIANQKYLASIDNKMLIGSKTNLQANSQLEFEVK
jgi:hypothetical protein